MSESSESDDSISESSTDSDASRKKTRRVVRHLPRIRRMRRKAKRVRRKPAAPRYQVEVVINGNTVKAFADTGADVSVMSKRQAKELGLKLCKTKMKIRPYGAKSVRCKGCFIGAVMHGDQVVNTCIYVVDQDVETLLSGRVSEGLGIIEFRPHAIRRAATDSCPIKTRLQDAFPAVFEDRVGRLHNYKVKFYTNEDVRPVAERRRPVPFHLR